MSEQPTMTPQQDDGMNLMTVRDEPILLRMGEAAGLLGLGVSTVKLLVAPGELPVVRVGRAVRIPRSELDRWVTDRTERHLTFPFVLFRPRG